jgi:hypothetical protein
MFSIWDVIILPYKFKKKTLITHTAIVFSGEEERKKEEENLKQLKELFYIDEQIIKDMRKTNNERKKRINELEIALSKKELKLKAPLREKTQKEIKEEKVLHVVIFFKR